MPKKDGCRNKVRHASLLTAQIVAKKSKNVQIHVYKCDICKGYHTGRSSDPWRKEKRLDQLFARIAKKIH